MDEAIVLALVIGWFIGVIFVVLGWFIGQALF